MSKIISENKNTRIEQTHPDNFNQFSVCCSRSGKVLTRIYFQNGAVHPTTGFNGCTMEDILTICKIRLEYFQTQRFACRENELAIEGIKYTLGALKIRNDNVLESQLKELTRLKDSDVFKRDYFNIWVSDSNQETQKTDNERRAAYTRYKSKDDILVEVYDISRHGIDVNKIMVYYRNLTPMGDYPINCSWVLEEPEFLKKFISEEESKYERS